MPLSEFAAKKAKPGEKPRKLFDGGGLYLHIHPSGSKHWRQKYQFNGKEKLLSFGPYPLVTIAAARKKREEAKSLLLEGLDPGLQKKLDKITAATKNRNTFELVAEEYIEWLIEKGSAEATLKKNRWLLQEVASPLASRPVNQITSAEVLDLLKRIEKSGRRETAKKLRGVISGVFRLAIMTLRAENDPTIAIRGALLPIKRKGRPAIVDEKGFGTLLNTIDEYTG